PPEANLREALEARLPPLLVKNLLRSLCDPYSSRKTLAADFRRLGKEIRDARAVRVAEIAGVLEGMAAEDGARARKPPRRRAEMALPEEIEEPVFRRRAHGPPREDDPAAAPGDAPARELVKIGLAAVPQLIEALPDERLLRSVGSDGPFTVGECAWEVL